MPTVLPSGFLPSVVVCIASFIIGRRLGTKEKNTSQQRRPRSRRVTEISPELLGPPNVSLSSTFTRPFTSKLTSESNATFKPSYRFNPKITFRSNLTFKPKPTFQFKRTFQSELTFQPAACVWTGGGGGTG